MSAILNRKARLPRIALPTNMPRGLIRASIIAAEPDQVSAEEVLRELTGAVNGRLKAIEADVDRLTNTRAGMIAAGAAGPNGSRPDPRQIEPGANEYRATPSTAISGAAKAHLPAASARSARSRGQGRDERRQQS